MIAESEHGGHAASVEIDVKEGLLMESFSKPLVAALRQILRGSGRLSECVRHMGACGRREEDNRSDSRTHIEFRLDVSLCHSIVSPSPKSRKGLFRFFLEQDGYHIV